MVDTRKIRAMMYIKGKSISDVAREMHIKPATLYSRLSGKSDFKISEAEMLTGILEIENPTPIFFENQVQ